ncbi:MAG: SpoIIE family protein phosphatase, partial [Bacteroidota bacterium]
KQIHEPGLILTHLHEGIIEALHQNESKNADGMDIGLCRLEYVNQDEVILTYAGAKRPMYYTEGFLLHEIKGDKQSIGGRRRKKRDPYANQEIQLERGSIIYLTTDGYVDQCDMNRVKLGTLTLKRMLLDMTILPLDRQQERLEEVLDNHQGGAEQRDDITILGLKL